MPIFSSYVDAAYVSVNGLISFGDAEAAYAPPSSVPRSGGTGNRPAVVAPLWSDVDTRGGSAVSRVGIVQNNRVYYRLAVKRSAGATAAADSVVLDRATRELRSLFSAGQGSFVAQAAVVATWYDVSPWPAAQANGAAGNTFQAVVVTDGLRTFSLLRYASLGWTEFPYQSASAVFNASAAAVIDPGTASSSIAIGGATGSDASALLQLINGSNVGISGLWAYRIDSVSASSGGCAETASEAPLYASLAPRVGSQFGGNPVYISGPCFTGSTVRCRFGSTIVDGRVISPIMAVCASPFQPYAGPVNVSVSLPSDGGGSGGSTGSSQWLQIGSFTYIRPDSHAIPAVTVRNLGNADSATCGVQGKVLLGLSAFNDTTQLAWYAPANIVDKLKREGRLRWSIEAWELRYGSAICASGGGGSGRRQLSHSLRRLQTSGGRVPSPALVWSSVALNTVNAGSGANGSDVWLTPDLPPDELYLSHRATCSRLTCQRRLLTTTASILCGIEYVLVEKMTRRHWPRPMLKRRLTAASLLSWESAPVGVTMRRAVMACAAQHEASLQHQLLLVPAAACCHVPWMHV